MQLYGKIFGIFFGLIFGGLIGLAIGFCLGHIFDRAKARIYKNKVYAKNSINQDDFFNACFTVMGHVARAGNFVSEREVRLVSHTMSRMGLQGHARIRAQNAFSEGKKEGFLLEKAIDRVQISCKGQSDLRELLAPEGASFQY